MAQFIVELVKDTFPGAVLASHAQHGDETLVVDPARYKEIARFLRDDPRVDMNMLVDLTAVDYPEREPRFEVVVHFLSLSKGHRVRLKVSTGDAEGENAEVDTLSDLWGSANWAEREVFDMFGVRFRGHPDLRRILMYPEFVGHPLRRDYPADRIQPLVEYRQVENIEKIAPFGPSEGMSFGRQTHAFGGRDDSDSEVS
jgi:NADH-quinone oxidoreductase subunit C